MAPGPATGLAAEALIGGLLGPVDGVRQVGPLGPGVEDAIDEGAMVPPGMTGTISLGQEGLDDGVMLVAQNASEERQDSAGDPSCGCLPT